MINFDDITVKVVKLVELITKIPSGNVIKAFQGLSPEDMPSGLYATVRVLNMTPIGAPHKQMIDGKPVVVEGVENATDLIDITTSQGVLMVSLNFYRHGANQAASMIKHADYREIVKKFLFLNNLGWQKTSEIRDLTQEQNADYEERAQIDLFLYAQDEVRDDIERIYSVSIEVTNADTKDTITTTDEL